MDPMQFQEMGGVPESEFDRKRRAAAILGYQQAPQQKKPDNTVGDVMNGLRTAAQVAGTIAAII